MSFKGSGKAFTIKNLRDSLDRPFLDEIQASSKGLFKLIDFPDSDLLTSFVNTLLSYYDDSQQVFTFGGQQLMITLEDILYLTGLPIIGEPIISSGPSASFDIFLKHDETHDKKNFMSVDDMTKIASDVSYNGEVRKIAVLLILIFSFIAPTGHGSRINQKYIKFVEDLSDIDTYAWGAALLAFLYSRLNKWVAEKNKVINGNLWVVLCFFLIRIPKLREAIGIDFGFEGYTDPLMFRIVEKVKPISHNHKPNYIKRVREILDDLSDEDIVWEPYNPSMLAPHLREQLPFRALMSPLFCDKDAVHHRPHIVAKQFGVSLDQSKIARWKECHIGEKGKKKALKISEKRSTIFTLFSLPDKTTAQSSHEGTAGGDEHHSAVHEQQQRPKEEVGGGKRPCIEIILGDVKLEKIKRENF